MQCSRVVALSRVTGVSGGEVTPSRHLDLIEGGDVAGLTLIVLGDASASVGDVLINLGEHLGLINLVIISDWRLPPVNLTGVEDSRGSEPDQHLVLGLFVLNDQRGSDADALAALAYLSADGLPLTVACRVTDPHDAEPQCVESSVLLAGHCVGGDGTQATEGLDPVGAVLIHCGLDCVGDLGLDVSLLLCHDF